jgi:hypothetical protein
MIDAPTATLIASALATAVAIVGFVAVVYYKLGKLEAKVDHGLAANRELTLSESRRLSDKMDADYARLSDKMDADYARLSDKMDADYARLSDKMDADYARLSDKMDADYARLSDKMDFHHAETMAAIQRLMEAFLSHSHDDDGNVIFRIPPGGGPD